MFDTFPSFQGIAVFVFFALLCSILLYRLLYPLAERGRQIWLTYRGKREKDPPQSAKG